jgi:hypothetical protein
MHFELEKSLPLHPKGSFQSALEEGTSCGAYIEIFA